MFLRHPLISSWRVDHGFGTIESAVRPSCRTVRQVHGTVVLDLSESDHLQDADGLIAQDSEIGVFTADCLPVLIADRSGRRVGAIHAGWRGATSGIVLRGLSRFLDSPGTALSSLRIVLGPAIGPCCFEVGPDVWEAVSKGTPGYRQKDRTTLDLWALVKFQLGGAGVPEASIGSVSLCTRCHPGLFFSHRGQGSQRQGRSMLNYICPAR